jgi:hypothetical protein
MGCLSPFLWVFVEKVPGAALRIARSFVVNDRAISLNRRRSVGALPGASARGFP